MGYFILFIAMVMMAFFVVAHLIDDREVVHVFKKEHWIKSNVMYTIEIDRDNHMGGESPMCEVFEVDGDGFKKVEVVVIVSELGDVEMISGEPFDGKITIV